MAALLSPDLWSRPVALTVRHAGAEAARRLRARSAGMPCGRAPVCQVKKRREGTRSGTCSIEVVDPRRRGVRQGLCYTKVGVTAVNDDEVEELLRTLYAKRVAAWQRGEIDAPANAPVGFHDSLRELIWYVGAKPSRDQVLAAGATSEQVDAALASLKETLGVIEESDLAPIPADLAQLLARDLQEGLTEEPENGLRRLNERWVKEVSDLRVEIYSNEGQHRGRPHVVVVLPDGKISVSLDLPPVLLTPHGYRGEATALKVVSKHRVRLLEIWTATRPDDQKLQPDADISPSEVTTPPVKRKRPT